jgi:hypothetical protein
MNLPEAITGAMLELTSPRAFNLAVSQNLFNTHSSHAHRSNVLRSKNPLIPRLCASGALDLTAAKRIALSNSRPQRSLASPTANSSPITQASCAVDDQGRVNP